MLTFPCKNPRHFWNRGNGAIGVLGHMARIKSNKACVSSVTSGDCEHHLRVMAHQIIPNLRVWTLPVILWTDCQEDVKKAHGVTSAEVFSQRNCYHGYAEERSVDSCATRQVDEWLCQNSNVFIDIKCQNWTLYLPFRISLANFSLFCLCEVRIP